MVSKHVILMRELADSFYTIVQTLSHMTLYSTYYGEVINKSHIVLRVSLLFIIISWILAPMSALKYAEYFRKEHLTLLAVHKFVCQLNVLFKNTTL